MIRVLFVCLGNICRSPMAEAVFRHKLKEQGLDKQMTVDSAGTGHWHIGKPPHEGTQQMLKEKGIDFTGIKARQVKESDLDDFSYIVAMDAKNVEHLHEMIRHRNNVDILRLLDFHSQTEIKDVPDPYFTGNFEEVYDLIDKACDGLLTHIRERESL